jgi:thiol:disulfide interchange protein DsbD
MKRHAFWFLVVLLIGVCHQLVALRSVVSENPLSAQAILEPATISAGANGTVKIYLQLLSGHHAYIDQFHLMAEDSTQFRVGQFHISPVLDFNDPFSKKIKKVVENKAIMTAPLEISLSTPAQKMKLNLELTYQACTKDYCLFPKTLKVPLMFHITSSPPGPTVTAARGESLSSSFQTAVQNRLWLAFLIVFFAGVLTSFTPCIFPMIPITLAVLGARAQGLSRSQRFLLSVCYVLGIGMTYSTLGVIVASTGVLFGAFLGNTWVIIGLAALFVIMGLSMLGLFEVALPARWQTALNRHRMQQGLFGAFASGLLAGIVASPCVGPVLVSLLTFVAQTQSLVLGFCLLFTFALGMGALFMALGLSTELFHRLPRSGPWMEGIKKIFAMSFFGLAIWYLRPILPDLWPVHSRSSEQSDQWQIYSKQQIDRAVQRHQPIVIDVWAEWCIACKELEVNVFNTPHVRQLTKNFLLLKFDATKETAEFNELKQEYGIVGLPFIIFYDDQGHRRDDLVLTGIEDSELFQLRLKKALH